MQLRHKKSSNARNKPGSCLGRPYCLLLCAQYHGQGRNRDIVHLANEYDIVVTTYQTVGADHHRARPSSLCCMSSVISSVHAFQAGELSAYF